ncbi:hypothetical protein NF556_03785 [Ornithinimicrobium faecis]|uniref:Uncharacterized protein n=1 Tax=Ornithinimicrobium faecis TaxID=2934158 RepID=A0ABY4YVM9_9MICO|nr:hypothetical protein [Ornithinimicrobium sp. HY1793]USQ80789.1 hypothetical protein NF556_03785 [Ornithinimicrobium sp. HY1793]
MSTRKIWSIAIVCLAVGMGLVLALGQEDGQAPFFGLLAGMLLAIVPIGLASNVTARRRRAAARAPRG